MLIYSRCKVANGSRALTAATRDLTIPGVDRHSSKKECPMAEPRIAKKSPYMVQLEPGDYWWCACGKSAKQPNNDNTHKKTKNTPKKNTNTSRAPIALCGFKHSGD